MYIQSRLVFAKWWLLIVFFRDIASKYSSFEGISSFLENCFIYVKNVVFTTYLCSFGFSCDYTTALHRLSITSVTGKFPATTLLRYRKQACWKARNPETARTNSKGFAANQNSLLSQLILKTTSLKRQQSHKTSHKTQAKSHDARSRLGETPSTEIYLKVQEVFKSANHQTITQAIANWNTWRKWEFASHMTIHRYKYRLIWTEVQSWKVSLFPPVAQRAEVKLWPMPENITSVVVRNKKW